MGTIVNYYKKVVNQIIVSIWLLIYALPTNSLQYVGDKFVIMKAMELVFFCFFIFEEDNVELRETTLNFVKRIVNKSKKNVNTN